MYSFMMLIPFIATSQADANRVPEYRTCVDWATAVARESDTVLAATSENSYFCCVLRTKDGRLAFCYYDRSPEAESDSEWRIDVVDLNNGDVTASGSDAREVIYRDITITRANAIATIREKQGTIYKLVNDAPRYVRVVMQARSIGEERYRMVFNHIVDMESGRKAGVN